jgi:type I restriction enzyme, S subunit
MTEFPSSWINTHLADVAQWGSGGTPSRTNTAYYGGDIPWIKTGELGQGLITDTEEKITELGLKNSSAKIFPKGSVAVAMYGATIGKTAILGIDAATNQACAVGVPENSVTTTEYLLYYLASQKDDFVKAGQGGAQPNISQAVIKNWPIPLAPLNEQKRIAYKLDQLLAKVDNCRERLDRIPLILKRFRQSVLSAATSGELTENWRNSKEQDPITEWRGRRIGDLIIGKPRNGYSPKAVEFETSTKSLTLTATTSGQFKPQYFKYIDEVIPQDSHLWLEPEDILVQRANTLEYVGVSAIYFGLPHIFIYPDLMMKCKANSEEVLTKFLYYLLSSNEVRSYFRENATGTAGNMPKINQHTVISAPVLVPSIQEQHEIIRQVEKLFDFADRLEARYQTARAQIDKLTPALLDKAFKGELVPQDPTDEPAAALLAKIQQARTNPENQTPKQPKTPRKPAIPKVKMLTRSTIQPSHLADILKNSGSLTAEALWNASKLSIDDFYDQLKAEELQKLLKEVPGELSSTVRLLEAI